MKRMRVKALILSIALTVTGTTVGISTNNVKAADYGLSNPKVDSEGNVTWDCVYFGNFNQTPQWTKEPIKWRVLSVDDNNNALIMSDKNLDCKPYNETDTDITWETSTLRSWLNGYEESYNLDGIDYSTDNFINTAFTKEEQSAINTTMILNNDNSEYGTEGGNNTEDKIYLLSIEDTCNPEFGFNSKFYGSPIYGDGYMPSRGVLNTDYANFNGLHTTERYETFNPPGNGDWWLRTPGKNARRVSYVDIKGWGIYGGEDVNKGMGVRPVMRINLSSSSVWTDAGVADSEGNEGVSADDIINNPVIENGITTWDCIYFGNYNQNATWEKEPIKWRVLSVDGDDAFLISDTNLAGRRYNENTADVTWEKSTIRSWLNGYGAIFNIEGIDYSADNFIDVAFTREEQTAIKTVSIVNNLNNSHGINGGNDTEDKIFLLSIEEAHNVKYGFDNTFDIDSKTRAVLNTDYARMGGCTNISGNNVVNGCWWLRSPGWMPNYAHYVDEDGCGKNFGYGNNYLRYGVRPALHINLASSVWETAGIVTSVMTSYSEESNTSPAPTETTVVTPVPTVTLEPVGTLDSIHTPSPKKDMKEDENKTIRLSSFKVKKNTTKITGKVSVSKATVKIKVGNKAWKKANVKGKKFTLKTSRIKKNTKVQIKVSKKGYKTLKKIIRAK